MSIWTVEFHSSLTVEAENEDEALAEAQKTLDSQPWQDVLSDDYELDPWEE